MSLKVITIDFWNTLFDSSNGAGRNNARHRALIKAIDRYGISVMAEQYHAAVEATWEMFHEIWNKQHRTPSPKELVEFIWRYLELPVDKEVIEDLVVDFGNSILEAPPRMEPDVQENLEKLRKKYALAIVSDTGFSPGRVMKELMKRNEIYDYFSEFSFSNETGVSKPNHKAFRTVLDRLDCPPEKALHIGDIERTDIAGAKGIGMKAILYAGSETNLFSAENPEKTSADAKVHSWNEIPPAIEKLD